MPEFGDEFLVALAESGLLIGPDQATAVQEELSERRTGEEREENNMHQHKCLTQEETLPQ